MELKNNDTIMELRGSTVASRIIQCRLKLRQLYKIHFAWKEIHRVDLFCKAEKNEDFFFTSKDKIYIISPEVTSNCKILAYIPYTLKRDKTKIC